MMVQTRRWSRPSIALVVALLGGLVPLASASAADPVFVGAGDIASCSRTQDEATAKLLDTISGTVESIGLRSTSP